MLIGKTFLKAYKAQINYEEEYAKLGNYTFYFRDYEEIEEEHNIECLDPPTDRDPDTNFAIENEIIESNEYRLDHLNNEETQKLKKVFYEFSDIQYREGENKL